MQKVGVSKLQGLWQNVILELEGALACPRALRVNCAIE